MNFLKFSFIFFLILSACADLPFTNEDAFPPEIKKEKTEEITTPDTEEAAIPETETPPVDQDALEESTILPESLELSEDTLIQNKTVILDKTIIHTRQYDLTIIAEEFISDHSVIRNFPDGETAEAKEIGKSGGHILIKTKKARGSLQLILNGENGGYVSRKKISKREKKNLSGRNGANGYNAVYQNSCHTFYYSMGRRPHIPIQECRLICGAVPTKGQNGENGRKGFPGDNGKRGGDSGSFHLQAFDMSGFHLTDIKKAPGIGSKGGKGSIGGRRGRKGRNGKDKKKLCDYKLSRPKNGRNGKKGRRGKAGENGKEGTVCLETLYQKQEQEKQIIQASTTRDQECEEGKPDIMCLGIAIKRQESEDTQRGNKICY